MTWHPALPTTGKGSVTYALLLLDGRKGYTVALAACADGTKLPAFIVFKEARTRILSRVLNQLYVPQNVKIIA